MGLFSSLFGGIVGAATGKTGCFGSCEASVSVSGAPYLNSALAVLSGVVGTWGVIEQYKNIKRMTELAEASTDRADNFLALANEKFNTVDIPTLERTTALYDRYVGMVAREDDFLCEAFSLKAYQPDYCLAEGRAMVGVQRVMDKSFLAKRRSLGRYDAGRACHDLTFFTTQTAIAKTNAAMVARERERAVKLKYDQWYWQRWKEGANYLLSVGNRATNALTGGASGLAHGLSSIGDGVKEAAQGASNVAGALANGAQFWGNVASAGFNGLGQAIGSGYFSSPAEPVGNWNTVTTSTAPTYSQPAGYTSFK